MFTLSYVYYIMNESNLNKITQYCYDYMKLSTFLYMLYIYEYLQT